MTSNVKMTKREGGGKLAREEVNTIEVLEEDTQKDKYLTFIVAEESYAIEIEHVTEIIGIQPITQVPELPDYIVGIINLRGKIIPVMDVRLRFKKGYRQYNDRTCIVVIQINHLSIGLIVDSVADVLDIPQENVMKPPEIKKSGGRYIKAVGKTLEDVHLVLDCDRLLNDQEYEIAVGIEE